MIWHAGNNEPKIPTGLRSLSCPWIRFVRRTLILTVKDYQCVFESWMLDSPPPDGNIRVLRIFQAQKGLLKSLIRWGGGDRHVGYQIKEEWYLGQGRSQNLASLAWTFHRHRCDPSLTIYRGLLYPTPWWLTPYLTFGDAPSDLM